MTGIQLLENSGIKFIGHESVLKAEEKTFVVIGVARGGTSLAAGSFDKLGIFTGDQSHEPVYEDVKLSSAYESNNDKLAKEVIKDYNDRYKVWAFKRPGSINYLEKLDSDLRNPIYFIIFKDFFSIANRNNISMKSDILKSLDNAFSDYKKILDFIENNSINGFLLSYEKVMNKKENFIDLLKNLIGEKNITKEQYESALEFIEPNPKKYLDATRITKSVGVIDVVNSEYISGWAKYVHDLNKSCEVELILNDNVVVKTVANQFRQDLKDKNMHNTGLCGFKIPVSQFSLKKGDKVSVKVCDDVEFLNNSNWIVK